VQKDTKSLAMVLNRPTDEKFETQMRSDAARDAKRLLDAEMDGLGKISFYELRPEPLPEARQYNWRDDDYIHMQKGQFATLYEFTIGDPFPLYDGLRSVLGPIPEYSEQIYEGFFSQQVDLHPDYFNPDIAYETHGLLLAMTHPFPSDEKEYEEWYVPVHLDDERVHGIHHSVTRYINLQEGAVPKSMTILETDWKDITEARQQVVHKYVPLFRWPPKLVNEVFVASNYQRVF
jgi:hypothetical protein